MAAINYIAARDVAIRALLKRERNWAARNPGVVLVFVIVFLVAVGVFSVLLSKSIARRRAAKGTEI